VLAVVDTGPLYAVADADDADHESCLAILERPDLDLVVPALVVAEATYLIGSRMGPIAEASFLRGVGSMEIESPTGDDWLSIAALVEQYVDLPLGGTDASIAVLADRLGTDLVVTLDHRHFTVVRSEAGRPYQLLP
jgi:predicted nucleic acid-binding protein